METKISTAKKTQSGFALLLTLVVVAVLISIGLSVLDLSIKQIRLSGTAKDSEVAFHAANAGLECATYWRSESADDMENGNDISPSCFETSADDIAADSVALLGGSDGSAYVYEYEFSWGSPNRCSRITAVVISADIDGDGATTTNIESILPGYPNGQQKACQPGTKCSVISVQGYNKACNLIQTHGTVQREVLLQL
jgi:Tfp pilus assembly protein PilX